jgi:hypothetical protein
MGRTVPQGLPRPIQILAVQNRRELDAWAFKLEDHHVAARTVRSYT